MVGIAIGAVQAGREAVFFNLVDIETARLVAVVAAFVADNIYTAGFQCACHVMDTACFQFVLINHGHALRDFTLAQFKAGSIVQGRDAVEVDSAVGGSLGSSNIDGCRCRVALLRSGAGAGE